MTHILVVRRFERYKKVEIKDSKYCHKSSLDAPGCNDLDVGRYQFFKSLQTVMPYA